jgi:hypothetical protein
VSPYEEDEKSDNELAPYEDEGDDEDKSLDEDEKLFHSWASAQ